MIFGNRDDETTPHGDESDELIELASPPAPPTRLERPLEGGELATEDGAGNAAPAPSSSDTEEDEGDLDLDQPPASSVTIRERMRQLEERTSSPGYGVLGKFTEARADREAQTADEDA